MERYNDAFNLDWLKVEEKIQYFLLQYVLDFFLLDVLQKKKEYIMNQ